MKKKKLLLLADSRKYIQSNCYQQQLLVTLQNNFDVTMVEADDIARFKNIHPEKYDHILSVLRLRSVFRLLDSLKTILQGAPLYLYEQDPWEGFMEGSPLKDAYPKICAQLNVVAFLNTSLWWSDFIKSKGIPSKFVRMGMLPKFCAVGKPWQKRKIDLAFQGSLHPHRKKFFDELAALNTHVTFLKSAPYNKFLKNLHDIRIYIHTEDAPWKIDGQWMPRNALWIKDTEAAARGCFSIRDYEDESKAYGIDEIPTIFTFKEVKDVPDILNEIYKMSDDEKNQRMQQAVQRLKERDDWMTVVRAIQE